MLLPHSLGLGGGKKRDPGNEVVENLSLLRLRPVSVVTTLEKFETQQSPIISDLCLSNTRSEKSNVYLDLIVFEKLHFKMFSVHTKNRKTRRFQIPAV